MARKMFGLLLVAALSLSWVAPLCAQPTGASHACCMGDKAPMSSPEKGALPACCRVSDSAPASVAVEAFAPAPALLSSVVISAAPSLVSWAVAPRFVPAAPQAPPGTHSGLSPPSSGL
ncbi:MAG: hypothetical protein COV48_16925 [Elusimicrobia bacterium CG11_big_fil_rev_8_21_14_0_20_64_6]|nr:MAG: hypothetical protein COV48_16925 [Elusimicrobia bacterium CG11_big_fil_rev_8_21_14_0_20_64_6]